MMRSPLAGGALVASLSWLGGCGGSSSPSAATPTATTTPDPSALAAGTSLSVVSGENGRAVGGAKLVIAGRPTRRTRVL